MRRVDGIPHPMHTSKLREMVIDREADVRPSRGSQRVGHKSATEQLQQRRKQRPRERREEAAVTIPVVPASHPSPRPQGVRPAEMKAGTPH